MTREPQGGPRRTLRLREYNYAWPGAYFVTVCAQHRECLFGEIVNEQMHTTAAGAMVAHWWKELGHKFPSVRSDTSIVMPNHFHGLVLLVGAALCGRPSPRNDHAASSQSRPGHPHRGAPTIGEVMDWFKTMTTNAYIRGVREQGWRPFDGKLWQRNYYEHIVRNEDELLRIREYVEQNPLRWALDRENPAARIPETRESWEV